MTYDSAAALANPNVEESAIEHTIHSKHANYHSGNSPVVALCITTERFDALFPECDIIGMQGKFLGFIADFSAHSSPHN